MSAVMRGSIAGGKSTRFPDDHPVQSFRGLQMIEVVGKMGRVAIGAPVVVIDEAVAVDAAWLARLARGGSWPGEMAERVEQAARRVLDACGSAVDQQALSFDGGAS